MFLYIKFMFDHFHFLTAPTYLQGQFKLTDIQGATAIYTAELADKTSLKFKTLELLVCTGVIYYFLLWIYTFCIRISHHIHISHFAIWLVSLGSQSSEMFLYYIYY